MRRVVVYSGTRNVYGDILTSMRSLLDHTKVDTVYLLIEDDEFSKPLPDVCRVINVSQQAYFKEKTPNYNSRWSYMALMKVALPDLLANEDIALHLDIDTVVVDDISDLWEIDISKYYFAAVREPLKSAPDFVYCNVGACLLNLKKMRESEIFKTMISELNVYYYPFPEQDVMAKYSQGYILPLSGDYNVSRWTEKAEKEKILHFAGTEDWYLKEEWLKYQDKSDVVLFLSDRPLERAENIKAVYDAYDGKKVFSKLGEFYGLDYGLVVSDEYVKRIKAPMIMIYHGIPGGKTCGLDQPHAYYKAWQADSIAYAITASTETVELTAKQCGLPKEKVLPYGMPRTDAYIGKKKGDGGTVLVKKRAYLYCPTFRDFTLGRKPDIDLSVIDELLEDDEVFAVKMHMVTGSIAFDDYRHIIQIPSTETSTEYLIDCDVLITDYSSILFDAHVLGKPVVLFEKDLDDYLENRGMYYEYPKGYASRHTSDERELVKLLRSADKPGKEDIECKNRNTSACDGNATKRVIDLIRGMI